MPTRPRLYGLWSGTLAPLAVAMASLFLVTGCGSGMDHIDRRLARVIGESAAQTHTTVAPRLTEPPENARDRSQYDPTPPTTNPAAGEMQYAELDRGEAGTPEIVEGLNARLRNYAVQAAGLSGDGALELSLRDALELSQVQGREYLDAEEDYLITAIGLLIERHRWGPRLFADSNVRVGGEGDEGRFENALSVVNSLRATQRLPYGGEAEARWVWSATEDLRSSVSGQYRQASELILEADLPLLRGAGLVAREDLIQAERDVVYAARDFESFRRTYFVGIAQDYFRLLQTIAELQNRVLQLESLRLYVRQQEALHEAGRLSEFQVNDARNQLVGAMSDLASTREQYTLEVDRFKVRLGIPIEQPVRLVGASISVSEPAMDIEEATATAIEYRLDLQNRRDQLEDARRTVRVARNQLLPDLNLSGQVGIPTDPAEREGGFAIDPDESSWEVGLLLSLPLDRRIERLQLRQTLIRLQQEQRSLDEFTDNVVLEVRQRLRSVDLARFRLELADARVRINERRLEEQRLKADEVDTRDRLEAEEELLNARNDRDAALTDLRVAILDFLDAAGQLRVSPEGLIDPIPGMVVEIEDSPIDFDALFSESAPEVSDEIEAEPDGAQPGEDGAPGEDAPGEDAGGG
ncbi:MAG TPA: TolC family protein [Phycisphaerales bacterium]|nr:TolC family protein [Phycisphaerales bacterium]